MKLRTELLRCPAGVNLTAGYSEGKYSAREHDALAAHAYQIELSRMREAADTTPRTHERQLVLNLLDALDRRADELMREWTTSERSSTPR